MKSPLLTIALQIAFLVTSAGFSQPISSVMCYAQDKSVKNEAKQTSTPATNQNIKEGTEIAPDTRPRVFITDSQSWQMMGGFGGSSSGFGGSMSGGASPQTAEIIKTFGERCKQTIVTMKKEKADYVVILEHEGGKGWVRKDNKFAIFNKDGDAIRSGSTRSLGGSVKDACEALLKDYASLDPTKVAPKVVNAEPAAEAVTKPAVAEPSTIVIKSTPDGADITVDGKFVGSTPSTLKLSIGEHTITIEKSGFKAWTRTMTVSSAGTVSIDATLQKVP